jgi:hypothetical protein
MGFWSDYRSSLKPIDVEEPVDVWLHRPVGYVIARLARPTPVTPNQITVASMVLGLAAGGCIAASFPFHGQVAGLCLLLSASFDCADGMLARMRRSFSALGRMLDGVADMMSLAFAVSGGLYYVCTRHSSPRWLMTAIIVGTIVTIQTSRSHTMAYDHYKNLFLRMTVPGSKDGDDPRAARASFELARARPMGPISRLAYAIYLDYLDGGRRFFARFDPWTTVHYDALPAYDPDRAAAYRKHCLGPMRLQRALFGVGGLMFGLELAFVVDLPEHYLLFRLVVLNAVFWLVLRPMQRRASREAFREIGFDPAAASAAAAAPGGSS